MDSLQLTYKAARRIAVAIIGGTVLLIGIIMLVTPGPALIAIPLGLGILGIEFAWARSWLRKLRESISERGRQSRAQNAESHRQRHTGW